MKNFGKTTRLLVIALAGLLAAACAASPHPGAVATASLDAVALSTSAAELLQSANAQATLAAGLLTATPMAATQAAEATKLSLQVTNDAFARQIAADAATSTAAANATQTRKDEEKAAKVETQAANQTATAWPPQATQTQTALNQEQTEATGRTITGMFWAAFWPTLALLTVLGLARAYQRLLPTFDLWLRTRRGANGETEIAVPNNKGGIDFVLPGKSAGPVLSLNPTGPARAEGMADPALQQHALTQDALMRMMALVAANPQAARALWQAAATNAQPVMAQATIVAEVVEASVLPTRRVPDQGDVAVWLDETEVKLLTSGGKS